MRRVLLALPIIALLVLAPSAFAGGWATVGLSSTPAGTDPGQPWNVNMTILQHGRTPLDDLSPTITIRNGDATKTFNAEPTGKPGVYRAAVVFPSAGKWNYEVNDGFITGQPHTYPPVEIGAAGERSRRAAPRPRRRRRPALGWLAIGGIALLLAAVGPARVGPVAAPASPAAGGVRATILAAGGLACAGAAMTIAAFAGGGSDDPPAPAAQPARADAPPRRASTCGSSRAAGPATRSSPRTRTRRSGPDLALSLHGKSRDYVMESIVLPNAKAAAGYARRRDARGLRAADPPAGPRSARRVPDGGRAVRLVACSTT